jgi:NAD-dependent SIR2 family protein deacetylase
MSQTPAFLCQKCASLVSLEDRFEQRGDLESYRCNNCGTALQIMVSRPLPLQRIDKWYSLQVCWKDATPSATELRALRKLHEAFLAMALSDLKHFLSRQPVVEFGEYALAEATGVQQEALQMGLTLMINQLPDNGFDA